MVIAFDIDDTITRHPAFFSWLSHALLAAGHTVIVITFRQDRRATEEDLEEWGIALTILVTASLEACLRDGVNEWKAAACREHNVEIFFEDDPDVLKHIDSTTLCLMPV